jgi:twitching motility protein PilT
MADTDSEIKQLMEFALAKKASDLHILVGVPPMVRVDGVLFPVPNREILDRTATEKLILDLVDEEQKEILLVNKEIDFSYNLNDFARFRINAYYQRGSLAAALRLLPLQIPEVEELGLPEICHLFAKLRQGFILFTGPTGHGKSTSLAAIINEINDTRMAHIITIEDPIEYVFKQNKSIISQRELRDDTHSWSVALRSCLREDPDVIMIGEMRDYETIAAALTMAETGHLVFATLHTNSAAQTVDRVVDVFPEQQQAQVRLQLAQTLESIVSQRLLPAIDGGRVPATEILVASSAVKTAIREGKSHLIDNIIRTSAEMGMVALETDLARLVSQGIVSLEVAKAYALRPDELDRLVKRR